MHDLTRTGRHLVVIQRSENILCIPAIYPVAVLVEHVHVEKMRPRVNLFALIQTTAAADGLAVVLQRNIDPDFVGIRRALREQVPYLHGAHYDLEQILTARLKTRDTRADRCDQLAIYRTTLLDTKDVHHHRAFQKLLMHLHDVRLISKMGDAGIGPREQVIMNLESLFLTGEKVCPKIL